MYRSQGSLDTFITQADWPIDFFSSDDLPAFLEHIYVLDYQTRHGAGGYFVQFWLAIEGEIAIALPGLDGVKLVFGGGDVTGLTFVTASLTAGPQSALTLENIRLSLRFEKSLLKPAAFERGEPISEFVEVRVEGSVTITSDFDIQVQGFDAFKLTPAMIGDSGVIIAADDVKFDLSRTTTIPEVVAAGFDESFIGVFIGQARVRLPEGLGSLVPKDNFLSNSAIGSGGFSGELDLDYEPSYDPKSKKFTGKGAGDFFGIPFGLESLRLKFKQNAFEESKINGQLLLPFFDKRLGVEIGLSLDGGFSANLTSAVEPGDSLKDGLLTLERPGLFEVIVESLGFEVQDGVFTTKLSGELTPLIAGFDWPTFKVDELSIDSDGNVHLEGGWLNLREQYSLDFHGFQFEITKMGFGKADGGGNWIGFSGGIKLIEGFPAGASVEGLRITWDEKGFQGISFEGIGIEFEVPRALRFKGAVAYKELEGGHRFEGDILVSLLALNIEVDGKLVIGKQGGNTYLGIYLGLELPAGIPLWATGVGIYGMAGLFALQMYPCKEDDEEWYEGWYKRPQLGVTDLPQKWVYESGGLAIGAGMTIGTISDNGYILSGRTLLVIVLPGPVLMIEGRANLLQRRSELSKDPLFRALAVIDARAGSFLIGLDAQYKFAGGGELIEIGGSAEAFFSFNDPGAWHLYLGRKEPRDKRIHARIFKLFGADSYWMLDADQIAFGAWIGFDRRWKFGPARITLEAWIENNVAISWKPVHFYGDLWLHGKAELAIFWFEFGLSLDARIEGDVFDPFHLLGEMSAGVNLTWPLPDFSVSITVEWGPELDPPPLPLPLKEVAIEHFKVTTSWPLPRNALLLPDYDANQDDFVDLPELDQNKDGIVDVLPPREFPASLARIPVVPLDCRPHITFGRSMNDNSQVAGVDPQNPSPAWEWIGDPEKGEGAVKVCFALQEISLEKCLDEKSFNNPKQWDLLARTPKQEDIPKLFGSWAPVPQLPMGNIAPGTDPPTANTKLWLWSRNPFDYTRHAGREWEEWFTDRFKNYPCPQTPADQEFCFDFEEVPIDTILGEVWQHPDDAKLVFRFVGSAQARIRNLMSPSQGVKRTICLPQEHSRNAASMVRIDLPYPVHKATLGIRYYEKIELTVHDDQGTSSIIGADAPEDIRDIQINGNNIRRVDVLAWQESCIVYVCLVVGPSEQEKLLTEKKVTHLRDELHRLSDDGAVLEPNTTYRLTIITSLETKDFEDDWFNKKRKFKEHAYFRTEGPPGFARLSIPPNAKTKEQIEELALKNKQGKYLVSSDTGDIVPCAKLDVTRCERLILKSDLNNLKPYVKQTTPPSVPAPGEKPPLPRPVYRAYDISVEFDEDARYVPQMYRMASRDLMLQLFDNNNQPVRDAIGRLITLNNAWGEKEELTFSRTDELFVKMLNASQCVDPPEYSFPHNKILTSSSQSQTLTADTLYEAKIIPLLLHNAFEIGLPEWETLDEGSIDYPSNWAGHPGFKGTTATVTGQNLVTLGVDATQASILFPALQAGLDYIVFAKDQNRHSGAYKIIGINEPWRTVKIDGTPKTEAGESSWFIPPALHQSTNVWGGMDDATAVEKPGTILRYKGRATIPAMHRDYPNSWTDYRLNVQLRSNQDGALGIVFRYRDLNNYYRFSMDRKSGVRRLTRVLNGEWKLLAEDDYVYTQNRDYLIAVEAIEENLQIYQDGALIFKASDNEHRSGTIGLYCRKNPGVMCRDLQVEDFRQNAPVLYRFPFTSSLFANFVHQMHSYEDRLQDSVTVQDLSSYFPKAVPNINKPTENEARNYEDLAEHVFGKGIRQLPAKVKITRILHEKNTPNEDIFCLESPEPIDWSRTELACFHSDRFIDVAVEPGDVKLIHTEFGKLRPNEESVLLLLRSSLNLTGLRVESHSLPGPFEPNTGDQVLFLDEFDVQEGGVLLREEFGPNGLDRYTIIDERYREFEPLDGESKWAFERQSRDGERIPAFIQTSEVYTEDLYGFEKPGTIAVTGSHKWRNIRLRAVFRSRESAIGILFRCRDEENYYRFSMDNSDGYQRLVKRVRGEFHELWRTVAAYDPEHSYRLIIESYEDNLLGYLDNRLIFSLVDDSLTQGQVGFYSWKNHSAVFEGLEVEGLERNPLLWHPLFEDLNEFEIFDSDEAEEEPSQWSVSGGALVQKSAIRHQKATPHPKAYVELDEGHFPWGTLSEMVPLTTDITPTLAEPEPGAIAAFVDLSPNTVPLPAFSNTIITDSVATLDTTRDLMIDPLLLSPDKKTNLEPATFVLGGNSDWEDIQISLKLRTDGDGGIGVMFRVRLHDSSSDSEEPDCDYYAFSMGDVINGGYRRLVKKTGKKVQVLRQNNQPFYRGYTADVTIRAMGSRLEVYVNGAHTFTVTDDSLPTGMIGLCCWDNDGARFERVVVTDLTRRVGQWIIKDPGLVDGPSYWRLAGGRLSQRSQIGGGRPYAFPGTHVLYEGAEFKTARISARLGSAAGKAIGIIFGYKNEEDYYRFSVNADAKSPYRLLVRKLGQNENVLEKDSRRYAPGDEFTLTVDVLEDRIVTYMGSERVFDKPLKHEISGKIGLYCHENPSARFDYIEVTTPTVSAYVLFQDQFIAGKSSVWHAKYEKDGSLSDRFKISNGTMTYGSKEFSQGGPEDPGFFALAGNREYSEVLLSTAIHVKSGALGVIFGLNDSQLPFSYYRFYIDIAQGVRCLDKKLKSGKRVFLWKDEVKDLTDVHQITICFSDGILRGFWNSVPMFRVEDKAFSSGKVGLYAADGAEGEFGTFQIHPSIVAFHDWDIDEDFEVLESDKWNLRNISGQEVSQYWDSIKGNLKPTNLRVSDLNGRSSLSENLPTTITDNTATNETVIINELNARSDGRISVQLKWEDLAELGVAFRYQNLNNFYCFTIDLNSGTAQLRLRREGIIRQQCTKKYAISQNSDYVLTVDFLGDQIGCYVNGVQLFRTHDNSLANGRVGLFSKNNFNSGFAEVRLGAPVWSTYYQFKREENLAAGAQIRIFSGNAAENLESPSEVLARFAADMDSSGNIVFDKSGMALRVVQGTNKLGHTRYFLPDSEFDALKPKDVRLLRKADGTGMFIFVPKLKSNIGQRQYRCHLTYRRDNRGHDPRSNIMKQAGHQSPETVVVDITDL